MWSVLYFIDCARVTAYSEVELGELFAIAQWVREGEFLGRKQFSCHGWKRAEDGSPPHSRSALRLASMAGLCHKARHKFSSQVLVSLVPTGRGISALSGLLGPTSGAGPYLPETFRWALLTAR